jgi:antitoxin Phd
MKRKVQVRQPKTSKLARPLPETIPQRHLPMAEAIGTQRESTSYISASEAKNRFATVLENVSKGQEVFITKHDAPRAVVISVERFRALSAATSSVLDRLTAEFDARLARMQSPEAQGALEKAFHASPTDLGRAALRMARSRS